MDEPLRPYREGTTAGGQPLDARGFVKKEPLRLGRANSLLELAEEYAFFTPAVLYLYGRFRDAPLADFLHMFPDAKLYYRKFDRPIFRGLEAPSNKNPDWNFVLWAVHTSYWRPLCDFLVSLTFTYEDESALAGVGEQQLSVIDPLAADLSVLYRNDLPQLTVTAFGLNGSRFRAAFEAGTGSIVSPPRLRFYGPDPRMVRFAQAIYSPLESPHESAPGGRT